MITHICDRCGRPMEQAELRYIAKIQVYAAPTPITITPEDLLTDQKRKIKDLQEQCERMTEDELMRDVHVEFQYDLCRRCQKTFITNPLAGQSSG